MEIKQPSLIPRIFIFLITLLLCAEAALPPAQAQPGSASEYQVKAAFLYNFAKFVEWPPEALPDDRPFVIGILGQDPFDGLIDEAVAGKTVRDRRIVVKRYSKMEDTIESQILYIGASEGENAIRIAKRIGRAPILTVSDADRFAEQGGMVQLMVEQNRVRFAINVAAVERAGLKPSSQLLKLARIVTGSGANRGVPVHEDYSDLSFQRPLPTATAFRLRNG
ncbi:MAG: YfiR family protein, partial [Candidatus Manganitrophaceae bacterium]